MARRHRRMRISPLAYARTCKNRRRAGFTPISGGLRSLGKIPLASATSHTHDEKFKKTRNFTSASAVVTLSTSMRSPFMQQAIAILCLLAFGLNSAVLERVLVRCGGADGSSRIEWLCDKDELGHCRIACDEPASEDDSSHHSQAEPCNDSPATIAVDRNRAFDVKTLSLPAPLLCVVPFPQARIVATASRQKLARGPLITGSPPSLWTIGTIVLLV